MGELPGLSRSSFLLDGNIHGPADFSSFGHIKKIVVPNHGCPQLSQEG
jgi:hypothetical protein